MTGVNGRACRGYGTGDNWVFVTYHRPRADRGPPRENPRKTPCACGEATFRRVTGPRFRQLTVSEKLLRKMLRK